MKISVVMASYLGEYKNAAKDRDKKIVRAINSVFNQHFDDWELILVSDGCEKTAEIYEHIHPAYDSRLKFFQVERGKLWGGSPRNYGISRATGDWITYLDVDDFINKSHLGTISKNLDGDWVWYNDLRYSTKMNEFFENPCELKIGRCGTSNVTHKRAMKSRWTVDGYAHDFHFIKGLITESNNFRKIDTPAYYVCHIPNLYDI